MGDHRPGEGRTQFIPPISGTRPWPGYPPKVDATAYIPLGEPPDEPTVALHTAPDAPPPSRPRRRRVLAAVATAAVVLVLVATFYAVINLAGRPAPVDEGALLGDPGPTLIQVPPTTTTPRPAVRATRKPPPRTRAVPPPVATRRPPAPSPVPSTPVCVPPLCKPGGER